MEEMFIKSYAKLNLFLDIIGKREDNYHLIESLFHTVSLYDEFIIKPSEYFEISTTGKYKLTENEKDNICTKVYFYFKNSYEIQNNYNIQIIKNIPTGAGLGGGSSNAATLIKFLNNTLSKKLDYNQLLSIAESFGADVPFFIEGGAKWVSGIGEKLKHTGSLPFYALIFYPNTSVSTKEAYSMFECSMFDKGRFEKFKYIAKKEADFDKINNCLYNIFEENVFSLNPSILNIKTIIENTLDSKIHLTGSGSALFRLYETEEKLEKEYEKISNNNYTTSIDTFKVKLI